MRSHQTQDSKTVLNEAQMTDIIDCILQGKYSSACLLLLESTGHNPLHYIPYRTYNRLQKQRLQHTTHAATVTSLKERIADLEYVEPISEKTQAVQGAGIGRLGNLVRWPYYRSSVTPARGMLIGDYRSDHWQKSTLAASVEPLEARLD